MSVKKRIKWIDYLPFGSSFPLLVSLERKYLREFTKKCELGMRTKMFKDLGGSNQFAARQMNISAGA